MGRNLIATRDKNVSALLTQVSVPTLVMQRIKRQTIANRRLQHRLQAA